MMINGQNLYLRFMEALKLKLPNKTSLVKVLTDILMIEKDAVYRRMRGEVSFTFSEIAMIANQLGISLDAIAGTTAAPGRPSHLKVNRHANPSDADYKMLKEFSERIAVFKQNPDSEIAEACNIFPQLLYNDFEYLSRFYLFVWDQIIDEETNFRDVVIPERTVSLNLELIQNMRALTSRIILDFKIFQYIINDIRHFSSIRRIDPEDVERLKYDLLQLIDFMEKISNDGHFKEGGKVYLFVSDVNLSTNYMYIKSNDYQISMVKAFILDCVVSYDQKVFDQMITCINSLKQLSTLISVSGGKSRAIFFEKQRALVESL